MQKLNTWFRSLPTVGRIGIAAGTLLLGGCFCVAIFARPPAAAPSATATSAAPAVAEATVAPTATPAPTNTRPPTNTPRPTNTRRPTNTPRPTNTATPIPEPIVLTGTGDDVIDSQKPSDAAMIAWIQHTGRGNFAVTNYGDDGERIDLLVNVIGNYDGRVPLDWGEGEFTKRFEVNASGAWTITILPLDQVRKEFLSTGNVEGAGDDIVVFVDGDIDTIKADFSKSKGNVAIWGYGDTGRDLLVNEIAPYTGTVIAGRGVAILVINAEGPWTLEVTKR